MSPRRSPARRPIAAARSDSYRAIYAVVARIPRGRVATYGQIARLAGLPQHARLVGYALHALDEHARVPWHRVVNARGAISLRSSGTCDRLQAERLADEGIEVVNDAVSLDRYQWRPRSPVGSPR